MNSLLVSGRVLGELKVLELKKELGKRGLTKQGNKKELFERLGEFVLANPDADSGTESENENLSKRELALERAREISVGIIGLEDERTVILARQLLDCGISLRVWVGDKSSRLLVDFGAIEMADKTKFLDDVDVLFISASNDYDLYSLLKKLNHTSHSAKSEKTKGVCLFTNGESGRLAHVLESKNVLFLECAWAGSTRQATEPKLVIMACGNSQLFKNVKPLIEAANGKITFLSDQLNRLTAHISKLGNSARPDFSFVMKILNDELKVDKRHPRKDGFLEYYCFSCGTARRGLTPKSAKQTFVQHIYNSHTLEILEEASKAQMALKNCLKEPQGDLEATNHALEATNSKAALLDNEVGIF